MDKEQDREKINLTFVSVDKNVQRRLMLLGYSFVRAVVEGETEIAKNIINEARKIKADAEDTKFE